MDKVFVRHFLQQQSVEVIVLCIQPKWKERNVKYACVSVCCELETKSAKQNSKLFSFVEWEPKQENENFYQKLRCICNNQI